MRDSLTLSALVVLCSTACMTGEEGTVPLATETQTLQDTAPPTAFRFTDLDLRDPHVFVSLLGCRDVTDTPLVGFSVNGQVNTNLTTDADGDTYLDFSPVLVFRPLAQGQASGPVDVGTADCSLASPTACHPDETPLTASTATNASTGTCLDVLPGTTNGYTPGITAATGPCFSTGDQTLHIQLSGIPITLVHAQFGATYNADPATGLVNGILRGFISEADANATVLPTTLPLVGGKPLSKILPGGTGACATASAKDTLADGTVGWWFYLNYVASPVAWSDTTP